MPSRSAKSTKQELRAKLAEVVEAEQEGMDILERFNRADRIRTEPSERDTRLPALDNRVKS